MDQPGPVPLCDPAILELCDAATLCSLRDIWKLRGCAAAVSAFVTGEVLGHITLSSPTKAYISEWPVTRQTNTGQMETRERADLTWHKLQRRSPARVGLCKTRGNLFGVSLEWSGASKVKVFEKRGWHC